MLYSDDLGDQTSTSYRDEGPWVRGYDDVSSGFMGPRLWRHFREILGSFPEIPDGFPGIPDSFPEIFQRGMGRGWYDHVGLKEMGMN